MEERIQKVAGPKAVVRRPPNPAFGDYAVFAGENGEEVAAAIRTELGESAKKVEVVKNGFVNVKLARGQVALAVAEAVAQGSDWGKGGAKDGKPYSAEATKGRRVIIEYSNPNAFKPMHIGHLMSTIIGEAVSRLVENAGATMARDTYGGDVGPHVAKAIWALQKKGVAEPESAEQIGAAYAEGNKAYEEDEAVKAEIDALNTALYEGTDHALMELWRKGRDVSMEAFARIWKLLDTKFDFFFFDSDAAPRGIEVVHDGLAKGIFEQSEGAVVYKGEKVGLHTRVFITSRGTPLYEAKDLGLAFLKEERWPSDESIILTAAEQSEYFKVIFAAMKEVAPLLAAKTTHVPHGFLRLTTGKMSSREGNVITAAGFIEEIIQKASEKNADPLIAEQVAIGAIKYMVLRQSPGSDIIFDPEKSLSLEGDSGPYLQYALVRAKKILAYATNGEKGGDEPAEPYAIERVLLHYPEVAARAARELAPNYLLTYLTELAATWNAFYNAEQILGSPEEAYKQRVAQAFANTMTNGLTLLGIPTPERM